MTSGHWNESAQLLFEAGRSGHRLADLPDHLRPAAIEDVYAIQDALIRLHGGIGGWKVAPGKDPGSPPRCTPIPPAQIYRSPARVAGDGLEIEVEIAILFGKDLPARSQPYRAADVVAAVATANPSFEIVGSRFANRRNLSMLTTLADLHGNAAVVYGEGIADWQSRELGEIGVTLSIDGKAVATKATSSPSTEETVALLVGLANHAGPRTGGIRAGQVVITGARIKLAEARPGSTAEADFAGLGKVSASFG